MGWRLARKASWEVILRGKKILTIILPNHFNVIVTNEIDYRKFDSGLLNFDQSTPQM